MNQTPFYADEISTRDVESALARELEAWILWGRSRDYLPRSFRCPLSFVYRPPLGEVHQGAWPRMQLDEALAEAFEKAVVSLPPRLRSAFVMHHLDRAHVHGHIRIIKGRNRKAQLLGVSTRQWHKLVRRAHQLLWLRWNQKETT